MSKDLPHFVTVTDGKVTGFECPWLYGGCHFAPDCSCESWSEDHFKTHGVGHEPIHHDKCWMHEWFMVLSSYGLAYAGDDSDDLRDEEGQLPRGLNRAGQITYMYDSSGFIEWRFAS